MNPIIKKIAGLLPELEARGNVFLFAIVEREGIDLLDVVISADWADNEMSAAVRTIADALATRLTPQDMLMLSRVVVLPSGGESAFLELPEGLENVLPGDAKVVIGSFLGLDVRRAFVIKSYPAPRISPFGEVARTIEFASQ